MFLAMVHKVIGVGEVQGVCGCWVGSKGFRRTRQAWSGPLASRNFQPLGSFIFRLGLGILHLELPHLHRGIYKGCETLPLDGPH